VDAASLGNSYVSIVEKPEPVSTYQPHGEVRYCNPRVTDCS